MTDRSPWVSRLAQRWYQRRTFGPIDLPRDVDLAARKAAADVKVSVVLPALNEASTIGKIVSTISHDLMRDLKLVDELVVIDSNSTDDTARIAREAGAVVLGLGDLLPGIPAERGKGEAMWRSLTALSGDIVVFIDADIRNFETHFVTRLIAPLLLDDDLAFVKAFYNRPIAHGDSLMPSGGGRVTELLARPLLNTFFPELSGLVQPLSGEYAGRRSVLMQLPFFTGYSVEVGLLIDLLKYVGLDAIAQVDLTERVHRNRPLNELGPMAHAISKTILQRAEEWGRVKTSFDHASVPLMLPLDGDMVTREVRELERPPHAVLLPTEPARREAETLSLDDDGTIAVL